MSDLAQAVEAARADLLRRANEHAAATGMELSYISLQILNDGKALSRLSTRGRVFPSTIERASAKLRELEAKVKRATHENFEAQGPPLP